MNTEIHTGEKELFPLAAEPVDMGNAEVFDRVFKNFYAQLCSFAWQYLKDHESAEDVVEGLFVNLWDKKEQFDNLKHARSYLYRSAYNSCLNVIRSNQRMAERQYNYTEEKGFTEESYLHYFLQSELIGLIYREIELLPEHYANVIRLGYLEGQKNEKIAEQLGLSLQTVKNYKSKALALLKGRLPKDAYLALLGSVLLNHFN